MGILEEKFWKNVDKKSKHECWEWTGSKNADGYGSIYYNKKSTGSHRISYIIHKGDIPEKMLILHRCDNPSCVNPYHLYAGTHQDNGNDIILKKYINRPNNGINKKYRTLLIEKLIKEKNEILLEKLGVQCCFVDVIKLCEYSYKNIRLQK